MVFTAASDIGAYIYNNYILAMDCKKLTKYPCCFDENVMMVCQETKQNWQKAKILKCKQHQLKAFEEINDVIVTERKGKRIKLDTGIELIEFMSCSYLGLDQDERVVAAAMCTIKKCGVNFAVARTRMRVESFVVLEHLLNEIFGGYCVTFTSLHLTHLGMLPLLASGEIPSYPIKGKCSLFILDKKAHASIQINRSLLQQFGEVVLVNFAQLDEIEAQFKWAQLTGRNPIALADGVGSMGGLAPVKALLEFAEKYDGYVYLDDAHGISVYGKYGCGYVLQQLEQFHPRLLLAVSLSKAFGANGAAIVVATQADEKVIRRFCGPYLFSNPLPLAIVDSAIAAAKIHLSSEIQVLQERLQERIQLFDFLIKSCPLLGSKLINHNTSSPIRGILIGDEFKTIDTAVRLRQQGFAVSAAMYPTVAKNEGMLRITLGADHRREDIKNLCENLRVQIF